MLRAAVAGGSGWVAVTEDQHSGDGRCYGGYYSDEVSTARREERQYKREDEDALCIAASMHRTARRTRSDGDLGG